MYRIMKDSALVSVETRLTHQAHEQRRPALGWSLLWRDIVAQPSELLVSRPALKPFLDFVASVSLLCLGTTSLASVPFFQGTQTWPSPFQALFSRTLLPIGTFRLSRFRLPKLEKILGLWQNDRLISRVANANG